MDSPYDDYCYECKIYGDNYNFNADTQEYESSCVGCPFNEFKDKEDD